MKKNKLVVLSVLVVVAGAAYLGVNYAMEQAVVRLLTRIDHNLPEGYKLSYKDITNPLLTPEVKVSDLQVTSPEGIVFSAAKMTLTGWPGFNGQVASLWSFSMDEIKWKRGFNATALSLRIDRPAVDIVTQVILNTPNDDSQRVSFAGGEIAGIDVEAGPFKGKSNILIFGSARNGVVQWMALSNTSISNNDPASPYRNAKAELVRVEGVPLNSFTALLNPSPAYWLKQPLTGVYVRDAAFTSLTEVSPEPVVMTVAEASVGDVIRHEGLPIGGKVLVTNLHIPPVDKNDTGTDMNIALNGQIDPATKNFMLEKFEVESPNKGKLSLKGQINGIPWPLPLIANATSWIGASLASLEIVYDDAGYVNSTIERVAKMQSVDAARVRADIRKDWEMSPFSEGKRMSAIGKTVLDFIDKPGRLTFVTRPQSPVLLLQVVMGGQDPEALAEMLNLFVTTQAP